MQLYRYVGLLSILLAPLQAYTQGQVVMIPRPKYVEVVPTAPAAAGFFYVYGEEMGYHEDKAYDAAVKDGLLKAWLRVGALSVQNEQAVDLNALSAQRLNAMLQKSNLALNICCRSRPIPMPPDPSDPLSEKSCKVYVLIQVQKDSRTPPLFDQIDHECTTPAFESSLAQWMLQQEGTLPHERQHKPRRSWENTDKTTPSLWRNFRYMHFTLLGLGIANFQWGIAQRFGGVVGVGYEATIGILVWSLGIRFYPYRHLFVAGTYGLLCPGFMQDKQSKKKKQFVHGPSLLLGIDTDFYNFTRRKDEMMSMGITVAGGFSRYPDGRITPQAVVRLNIILNFFNPERAF